MKKTIPLATDTITKTELLELAEWLQSGSRLTKGMLTSEFETKFAEYLNIKHSIFVNSGSSANLLMIYALMESGRLKNKKVVAPAVSWVTTVSPLMQFGFDICLCDCDKNNLGLSLKHFEAICAKEKPALAVIVDVLGHANQISEIMNICEKYNIILLEDSCEALGSVHNNKMLGTFGLCGSFSFYYGHHISTIEGGAVVTDDTELYNIMLSIRSHGWSRDVDTDVHNSWKSEYEIDEFRDLYTFYYPGFNLRSSDLNAFLGISQLKKMELIVNKRNQNYEIYAGNLQGYWQQKSDTSPVSSFAYGVIVDNTLDTYKYLKTKNIETRPLICGSIGRHPFWIKKYGKLFLKNADIVHDYGLYLPNNYNIGKDEIEYICDSFKKIASAKNF